MAKNWNWDDMFGEDTLITIKNEERKYFCLDEINPKWEKLVFYSKTNIWYKRTIMYFDGNVVVKLIYEMRKLLNDNTIAYASYSERDMRLETKDREILLPKTSRGKAQKLTPTNVMTARASGCSFALAISNRHPLRDTYICIENERTNRELCIGERDIVGKIKTNADFRKFVKYFIDTCPDDYFEKVREIRYGEPFKPRGSDCRVGDIVRMEYDRTNYCYGLVTGKVTKIREWEDFPEKHSFHSMMSVPIMFRLYDIITPNKNMTPQELENVPLRSVDIACDGDIYYGKYPVVGHKKISARDLQFNINCYKSRGVMDIEWGMTNACIEYDRLSDEAKEFFKDYGPKNGVVLGIGPDDACKPEDEMPEHRTNLLMPHNRHILNELFELLGLAPDSDFDDFAEKFGGLTLNEIAERLSEE